MRILFLFPCLSLFANPSGLNVISGEALLDGGKEHILEVGVSDRAILEWDDFSIERHECTRFIQDSSRSIVLNRVVGSNASRIDGTIESNGNVFLVNVHGVLIGKSATLNSESFFISAFPLSDQAFLNRSLVLHGDGGQIVNEGTIFARSGDVRIAGREVVNFGKIEALLGQVFVSSFFEGSIAHRGTIAAGQISLIAPKGEIHIEGSLNVDGLKQGGEISILSDSIYICPLALLSAQGGERGGEIVLQAEKNCSQHGMLLAEGGFIEVSGKETFELGGKICAGSLSRPGKLLLDPTDIDVGLLTTTPPSFAYPPAEPQFDRPGPTAFLDISELVSQLENGVSVTIQTTPGAGGVGRIRILSPIAWNQGTNLSFIADESIQVFADIENFTSGSLNFTAGQDLLVQSTSSDRARINALSGNVQVSAVNLQILSGGAPAQINVVEGGLTVGLTGDLTISGGMGADTDAVASLSGRNAQVNVDGAVALTGGGAARNRAEMSATSTLDLQIGGTLTLLGGGAIDASAVILGNDSLILDVGLGASITSGAGGPSRIGSDYGRVQIDVGTSMPSTLSLTGTALGGDALINAHGDLSLSSTQNISSARGQMKSRSGSVSLIATNQINLSQNSLLSSFASLEIASGPITFDSSKLMASHGGASVVSTGAILFQNDSEISTFPTALFQGATFNLNQSIIKGIGSQTFEFTGAISFLNSVLFHFPRLTVNSSSWTIDQSLVHLTSLDSTLSGNLVLQNGALLNVDNRTEGTLGGLSLNSSVFASGTLDLDAGATSLMDAFLSVKGVGILSGTSLTMTTSTIESTQSTLQVSYSGNGSLIDSTIGSASDFSAGFAMLSMNQSILQSLTSSHSLVLTNTGTLTNGSTLRSGRLLSVTGTQLNLSSSRISSLSAALNLSTGLAMTVNSDAVAPISFSAAVAVLCSLNLSTIRGGDAAISGPTLQLVDSTIQGDQSFHIQVPNLSLMNSIIFDPYSSIQN